MKKLICFVIAMSMMALVYTGCKQDAADSAPIEQISDDTMLLTDYLSGSSSADYQINTDTTLDLSDANVNMDKQIILGNATLTLTGTYAFAGGCITVRADASGGALDMSALVIEDIAPDTSIFEIHESVTLSEPSIEGNVVIVKGEEWTSIRTTMYSDEIQEVTNTNAATPEVFMELFNNPSVTQIDIGADITVNFDAAELSRNLRIDCGSYALTLAGSLNFNNGGGLEIGVGPDQSGTLDISGLSVTADGIDTAGLTNTTIELVHIQMNFRQIIGEPLIPEELTYSISDDGELASIYISIGSDLTQIIQEDLPIVLSGGDPDGNLLHNIDLENVPEGVIVVELDNPVITDEIWITLEAGTTLKITGSVTFDGGLYRFGPENDSEGVGTVDISELEISGIRQSESFMWVDVALVPTNNSIELIYDETDERLEYLFGGGGNYELRLFFVEDHTL